MINTAKSSRMRVWKYLLIVPVLAIAGVLLSASNPAVAKKEAPGERYMETVNSATAGVTPRKGDEYYASGPKRLLRVAAEESPYPLMNLTTDTSYMRRFPGGKEGYLKYISSKIRYPQQANLAGITGIVYAQYKLMPDGSVKDVVAVDNTIHKKADKLLADEVVRVLQGLPKFNPAPGGTVETISTSAAFYLEGEDNKRKPAGSDSWKPDIVIVGYGIKK